MYFTPLLIIASSLVCFIPQALVWILSPSALVGIIALLCLYVIEMAAIALLTYHADVMMQRFLNTQFVSGFVLGLTSGLWCIFSWLFLGGSLSIFPIVAFLIGYISFHARDYFNGVNMTYGRL